MSDLDPPADPDDGVTEFGSSVHPDRLAHWFREFAERDCRDLPLYRAIGNGVADDPELLALLLGARTGQWRPVLFFAAIHSLVLDHPDDELSQLFPTVTGRPSVVGDPMPAVHAFVEQHRSALIELISTRSTQTNEPNRSCLWQVMVRAAAIDVVDVPVAFIEVGASAGVNLWFDRYRTEFDGGQVLGDPASDVHLRCEAVLGSPPLDAVLPPVVWRRGLDLEPIDPCDPRAIRWLKACVWAEQPERHQRFDAVARYAAAHPPRVVADDAVDGIAELVESAPEGSHIVVVHSWVLTYLERRRREAFVRTIELLGQDRCLTWISAEGADVTPGVETPPRSAQTPNDGYPTIVGMSQWRHGTRTDSVPVRCHPHLRWLEWLG